MPNRPKDFSTEATIAAPDDFEILDGATLATRKIRSGNRGLPHFAPRGGIISTGASAVGTTWDNTGLAFGTGNLSGGAWRRLSDWTPASDKFIFAKAIAGTGVTLTVRGAGVPGALRLALGNGAGGFTNYDSTVAIPAADGAWVFIAWTLDRAGNVSFYVNGALLGTAVSIAAQSAQTLTSTGALYWGANYDGGTISDGTLGEAWLISGLLTATQVADIYRAGSIAPFSASFTFFQWLDFAQGYGPIIKDRSGQNQPALMGTSGLTHAVPINPRGNPSRAPMKSLVGDGSNSSFAYQTLGAQDPAAGDLTWWHDFTGALADGDSSTRPIGSLSSSNAGTIGTQTLICYYGSGQITYRLTAATSADWRQFISLAGFATLLANKRALLVFTRTGTTVRIYLGIDGDLINVTALFLEQTFGTPPAWSGTITGTYNVLFTRSSTVCSAITIYDARIANVALTEAQVRAEYERGDPGLEWKWGKRDQYISDFTAGVNGFVNNQATATGNVDGVTDGTTSKDDVLRLFADATNSTTHSCYVGHGTLFPTPVARSGYIEFDYYIPAGNTNVTRIALVSTSGGATNAAAGPATVVGTWTRYTSVLNITGTTPHGLQFNLQRTDGAAYVGANVSTDDRVFIKDIRVQLGGYTSRVRTDMAGGLTVLDGSTNKLDFLLSTTGVTVSPDGRVAIIRATTNTNGNQQLAGASVIDTTKRWRIRSWNINSSGTPTVSLGSASAGAQYVSGKVLTATDNNVTDAQFVSRVPVTANLWCNANSTATLEHTVILDLVD